MNAEKAQRSRIGELPAGSRRCPCERRRRGNAGGTVFFLCVCEREIAFESECGDEIEAARHRRRTCGVDLE